MKKFLSIVLACLMVLSLAACSSKDAVDKSSSDKSSASDIRNPSEPKGDSSEQDVQTASGVTAESLIETGYGVGIPESATLYYAFTIAEGSRSRTINCTHEYDGSYDHMAVTSQVDEDGTEVPMEYEFYYSYADSTIYQVSDGEVTVGNAERFECGLTKPVTVAVKLMVQNPVIEERDEGYVIKGKCPVKMFNDMLSFVYTDAVTFTEDVDIGLLYDKDTKMLTLISWYATSGITEYEIDAVVDKVNSTTVTFGDSSSSSGSDEIIPNCKDDEMLLAEVLYGKDFLYEDDIANVGTEYSWTDDDVLFQFRYFCNFYSREGFLRRLGTDGLASEDEQKAAVVMCKMLEIPKEILWQNGYTTKELAETYWSK